MMVPCPMISRRRQKYHNGTKRISCIGDERRGAGGCRYDYTSVLFDHELRSIPAKYIRLRIEVLTPASPPRWFKISQKILNLFY
jgi:hypothetical protein